LTSSRRLKAGGIPHLAVRVSCFVQTSLPRYHSCLVLQSVHRLIDLPDCPSVGSQSGSHRLHGSRKRQLKERCTLVKHASAFTWRNDLRQNPQTLFRCQCARTSVSRLSRLSLNRHSVNTQCMSTTALSTKERNGTFIPSPEGRRVFPCRFDKYARIESRWTICFFRRGRNGTKVRD